MALVNKRPSPLAAAALEVARTQLGVMEDPLGSNNGPEVKKYLAAVGLDPGFAWCMAFVYWCVGQAAEKLKLENPLVKTGGVAAQLQRVKGKTIKVYDMAKTPFTADMVRAGDIAIMMFTHGMGHTFFIDKAVGQGNVLTIEGNTNKGGSREGIGVFQRRRLMTEIKAIIRICD